MTAGAGVAALVLLGGPAWAQEDPCAPGPDGSVPEMCQSGPAEPATPTVDVEPAPTEEQVCPDQPVEPGDGTVVDAPQDGGEPDEGIAVGEPAPGTDPAGEARPAGEPTGDVPAEDLAADSGPVVSDPTVICAFGVPVSAPVDDTAGGGAAEGAGGVTADGAVLPRTGPERVLALTAVGAGLVVAGAAAVRTGRRRTATA